MAINIGINCSDCSGVMELTDPPIGHEFNEQGVQEAFCNNYGHGFKREILHFDKTVQSTFVNALSNRKLGDIIHALRIRAGLPHLNNKKQSAIQEIRTSCNTKVELIEFLVKKYNENYNYLESKISLF